VSVASQKGIGSRFIVECVFAPAQLPEASSLPSIEIEGYEGEPRRILIADDDSDNRALLTRLLESVGFLVRAASDGREALDWLGKERVDLIVTDLMMPRMDGMRLVSALRAEPAFAELPVMAMSASASRYTREEALRAGCSEFLSKPLALAGFLEAIGNQLGLRWKYRGVARSSLTTDPSPAPAVIAFKLSPELTAELQHLAKQGDIMTLTARVDAALGANAAARSFCEDVRALAARYDVRGIRQVLAASST
jgi:CheY-like chemotaxis protein